MLPPVSLNNCTASVAARLTLTLPPPRGKKAFIVPPTLRVINSPMSSCISISVQAAARLETTVVPVDAIAAVLVSISPESKKSTGAMAVNFPMEADPAPRTTVPIEFVPAGKALAISTSPMLFVPAGSAEAISTSPMLLVPAGNEATTSTCTSVPDTAPASELVSPSIELRVVSITSCFASVAAPVGRAEE